ncbi:MAG: efflux transporter outer membrane subunit [Candidatus Amulumruptor caecigallinarius]|nr:efflux transporter outer membrane subunit [Candidatus Amulumruptor caecigallinarius]
MHYPILRSLLLLGASLCVAAASAADFPSAFLRDSLPDRWQYESPFALTTPSDDKWWEGFNDAALTGLIKRAVENNFNVLAATQRIEAARAMVRRAKAAYYPQLGISAGWQYDAESGRTTRHVLPMEKSDYFSLGLNLSWEIDLFGKIRANVKSERANYEATVADCDAVLISLCSELAKAYFSLRSAQESLKVTEEMVATDEELLKLANTRYDVGLVPKIDVVQARMTVTQARSAMPQLNAEILTYLNEIALLTGVYPDKLSDLLKSSPLPAAPDGVAVASPQTLLRRRPDIVAAEKQLAYYASLVGVAKKDFLPSLELTASVGTDSHDFKGLFGRNSLSYSVMPTLSWTIFEGFARNAAVAEAKAQFMAEVDSYNLTVMTAVQEVDNAMISAGSVSDRLVLAEQLLKESNRELELQVDRYRQGLNSFDDVADALANVLNYRNECVSLRAARLNAAVTLYTALGGGF